MSTMYLGTTVKVAGGLFPTQLLDRVAGGDLGLNGNKPQDYHADSATELNQAINRAWTALTGRWASYRAALEHLVPADRGTTLTRDRWLLPLFQELGYGRLPAERAALVADGREFAISHRWGHVPIHLIGARLLLDKRVPGERGAAASAPHGLVQDLLNHADEHLWAFVSNGLELRILRDHKSLTRQAYVSFDLEAMFDGEQFGAFRLLYLLCHQSRVEGDDPKKCWLEQWVGVAQDEGVRALDRLRDGVEQALVALGTGFIRHRANDVLRDRLSSGALSTQDYYRQLLRLVYRLLFLFVAEDRDLLLIPDASEASKERYQRLYSSRRLRRFAMQRRGGPHEDGWQVLRLVMRQLDRGNADLALPGLGSFLWKVEAGKSAALPDLDGAAIANEELYGAVAALCVVQDGPVRRPVDWAGVQSDELGSVYESLMEKVPRVNVPASTFQLDKAASNERKTSGSYYTPRDLVECVLTSALDPVLDGAMKQLNPEQSLLELAVVDPACGSGHFLVAAATRIARRLARIRCGGIEPSPPDVQHAMRDVVGKCIYGVDLNPMAVELCKVSLWMEAIDPGRPLSFLDAHIRHGNALVGATREGLEAGIPDAAWEPGPDDDKAVAKRLRKETRSKHENLQAALPFAGLSRLASMLEEQDESSRDACESKERRWHALSAATSDAWLLADLWCAAFVWPKQPGEAEEAAPVRRLWDLAKVDPSRIPAVTRRITRDAANRYAFFHWELAYPIVFARGGFDCVVGNPPYVDSETMEKRNPELRNLVGRLWSDATGNWDLFVPFCLLAAKLLRPRGLQAAVTPNKLLGSDYVADLHKVLLSRRITDITDFSGLRMFAEAAVDVVVLTSQNAPASDEAPVRFTKAATHTRVTATMGALRALPAGYIGFPISGVDSGLLDLVTNAKLRTVATVGDGSTTAEAYEIRKLVEDGVQQDELRPERIKLVNTGTIDPFRLTWGAQSVKFLGFSGLYPVLDATTFATAFPKRAAQAMRSKVVVAGLATRIEAAVAPPGWLCGKSAMQVLPADDVCPYAIAALLNSRTINDLYRGMFGMRGMGGNSMNVGARQLELLPVPGRDWLGPYTGALDAPEVAPDAQPGAELIARAGTKALSLLGKALHARVACGAGGVDSSAEAIDIAVRKAFGWLPAQSEQGRASA